MINDFAGMTVLVTGASAGLGAEFCKQLAPEAKCLIMVARRLDRLKVLSGYLADQHPGLNIEVAQADLGNPEEVDKLLQTLHEAGLHVDFLINNAGLGDYGLLEGADWEKTDAIIQVNIRALTQLTQRLLPDMLRLGRGAILNISSIAGFMPIPSFAVYAASKAYVNSFTEALRSELVDTGVTVTALCPGPVPTEFGNVAARPKSARAFDTSGFISQPAERVVREALAAVKAGRPRVIPGLLVNVCMGFVRIAPVGLVRWIQDIAARRAARVERKA